MEEMFQNIPPPLLLSKHLLVRVKSRPLGITGIEPLSGRFICGMDEVSSKPSAIDCW